MNGLVMSAFRIPEQRVLDHFAWNLDDYLDNDVEVFLNVESRYEGLPDFVEQIVYPYPVSIYCAGRVANYGLRMMCDIAEWPVIIKTDIDIAFDGSLKEMLKQVTPSRAIVPLYFMADSYERRKEPCYCAYRAEGTIIMLAENWIKLRGYNEIMTGYTCDDGDMVQRIMKAGIHAIKYNHIYHIAHAGGPQQDGWTPGATKYKRTDQWNPDIHPLRIKENLKIQSTHHWDDPDWGLIEYWEDE